MNNIKKNNLIFKIILWSYRIKQRILKQRLENLKKKQKNRILMFNKKNRIIKNYYLNMKYFLNNFKIINR